MRTTTNRTRAARIAAAALSIGAVASMAVTAWSGASAAGIAKGAKVTYSKANALPPAPKSTTGATGSGDGFDLSFDQGQSYNVFHHQDTVKVDCHVQATGAQCAGFSSPVEILANGNVKFWTSMSSSTAINPINHHLFVYVNTSGAFTTGGTSYADATAGVLEVDLSPTAPDRFVRFIPTTPAGEGPKFTQTNTLNGNTTTSYYGSVGGAILVGKRFYAINPQKTTAATTNAFNTMMCVDITTGTACAGQPYSLGISGAPVTVQPSGFPIRLGSRLITTYSDGATKALCFDTATDAPCVGSWPIAITGAASPLLDTSGAPAGVCTWLNDPTTSVACFGLDGAAVTAPAGYREAFDGGSTLTTLVLGTRVYLPLQFYSGPPNNTMTYKIGCYDFATSAVCPGGFPKDFPQTIRLPYTLQVDPADPSCIWTNADGGTRIQALDPYTGGACGASGSRSLLSSYLQSDAGCAPSKWGTLEVTSTVALVSASVKLQDSAGTEVASGTLTIAGGGLTASLDLSTLTALSTTAPYPSMLLDLKDANGVIGTPVDIKISWEGTYDEVCTSGGQTATDGTTTLTGSTTTTVFGATTTMAPTTSTLATTTTAAATTTTVAGSTTTTAAGATTTTSAGATTTTSATTTTLQQVSNTALVTPSTASTTTSIAPIPTTVAVSVLGVAVTAPTSSTMPLPVAAPASASPAFTGGNDLDLALAALVMVVMAAVVLGTEKLTRHRGADHTVTEVETTA